MIAIVFAKKMQNKQKNNGFSLIEIMVVLLIMAILSIATVAVINNLSSVNSLAYISKLKASFKYARHKSLALGETIVVCPEKNVANKNDHSCATISNRNWSLYKIIFFASKDGTADFNKDNDYVITTLPQVGPNIKLFWRGFPNTSYIKLGDDGFSSYSGHFAYCYKDKFKAGLVVNSLGRIRDTDHDDADLSCN